MKTANVDANQIYVTCVGGWKIGNKIIISPSYFFNSIGYMIFLTSFSFINSLLIGTNKFNNYNQIIKFSKLLIAVYII